MGAIRDFPEGSRMLSGSDQGDAGFTPDLRTVRLDP